MVQYQPDFYILSSLLLPYFFIKTFTKQIGYVIINPKNWKRQRCIMNHKDIVKYFYEVIVSENMLDELPEYIAEDCVQRIG